MNRVQQGISAKFEEVQDAHKTWISCRQNDSDDGSSSRGGSDAGALMRQVPYPAIRAACWRTCIHAPLLLWHGMLAPSMPSVHHGNTPLTWMLGGPCAAGGLLQAGGMRGGQEHGLQQLLHGGMGCV